MDGGEEVATSPREFRFVMNCADYHIEFERLMIVLGSTPVTKQKYDEARPSSALQRLGKDGFGSPVPKSPKRTTLLTTDGGRSNGSNSAPNFISPAGKR